MFDIKPEQLNFIIETLKKHVPECEVRAFGSRVKGTAKPYSDFDLALIADQKIDRSRLNRLEEVFEESDLPFQIDILDWYRIDPGFQKIIEENYQVLDLGVRG